MASHSSILAWKMPWTEETGGLQSMGSQRFRHDFLTKHTHTRKPGTVETGVLRPGISSKSIPGSPGH